MSSRSVDSNSFTAVNGVEKGAVLSPTMYYVYIGDLLKLFCDAWFGSYLGTQFVGALAYADLVAIAPTVNAMPKMLAICDDYAIHFSSSFNACKSKWLAILLSSRHAVRNGVD